MIGDLDRLREHGFIVEQRSDIIERLSKFFDDKHMEDCEGCGYNDESARLEAIECIEVIEGKKEKKKEKW